MKIRLLLVMAVCLMLSGSAFAVEALVQQGSVGCQTMVAYDWMDLGPGERWSQTIDMRGCTDEQMGSFYFYGFIAKQSSAPAIKVRDGIVLTVKDLANESMFACNGNKGDWEAILLNPCSKSMFEISAENTTRKPVKVRFTWNQVTTN